MPDRIDNRRHSRLPLILQAEFPEREGYLESTENLSEGGLFVRTSEALAPGTRIPMRLSFPGLLDSIDLVGIVVWSRPATAGLPAGAGINIADDLPGGRARLRQLMSRLDAAPDSLAAPVPRAYSILVADDNPHLTEIYEYALRRIGFDPDAKSSIEIAVAANGHEALAHLAAKTFNLLITDLYMPVLDGFELIERVRANQDTNAMPILAVSGTGTGTETRARLANLNVSGYLRKPVRFADLLDTVRRLLIAGAKPPLA